MIDMSDYESRLNANLSRLDSVEALLRLVRLDQYSSVLIDSSRKLSVDEFINGLVLEDLEEIGVKKLGHQKRLMFVCKRLKEIRAGLQTGIITRGFVTNLFLIF